MITHSTGGGTGSGFVNLVMEKLEQEYADKTKISFSVLPGDQVRKNVTSLFLVSGTPIEVQDKVVS